MALESAQREAGHARQLDADLAAANDALQILEAKYGALDAYSADLREREQVPFVPDLSSCLGQCCMVFVKVCFYFSLRQSSDCDQNRQGPKMLFVHYHKILGPAQAAMGH